MPQKIESWDALKALRVSERQRAAQNHAAIILKVGMATCGVAAGAAEVMDALKAEIAKAGLKDIEVASTGCYGYCYAEPMVELIAEGRPSVRYGYLDVETAAEIINKHVVGGEILAKNVVEGEVLRP
jgi:(2Fe-2S) ferredoxin